MGWDGIVGYLTSHEAYCLCVGNHSGHNLHTRGWGDMRWKASPTGIRTQYHPVKGATTLPTELTRLACVHQCVVMTKWTIFIPATGSILITYSIYSWSLYSVSVKGFCFMVLHQRASWAQLSVFMVLYQGSASNDLVYSSDVRALGDNIFF